MSAFMHKTMSKLARTAGVLVLGASLSVPAVANEPTSMAAGPTADAERPAAR